MDEARNLPSEFQGSGAINDAEMEALSEALQSNSVPLMVVACQELRNQFIHHPESATLHFLRQGPTDKSMLQALCCCISSGDETCYREASIVLVRMSIRPPILGHTQTFPTFWKTIPVGRLSRP